MHPLLFHPGAEQVGYLMGYLAYVNSYISWASSNVHPRKSYLMGYLMGYIMGYLMGYLRGYLMGYLRGYLMGYLRSYIMGYPT